VSLEKVLVWADYHYRSAKAVHCDHEPFFKFAAFWKPDVIINLGDFIDFDYIAKFNKKYLKYIGYEYINDRIHKETDYIHDLFARLQDIVKPKEMYFTCGNHEERVHVYQRVNGDIEQRDISQWLRLKELGINYLPLGSVIHRGKLHFTHGENYCGETSC